MYADVVQLAEHRLGKAEVAGSIPVISFVAIAQLAEYRLVTAGVWMRTPVATPRCVAQSGTSVCSGNKRTQVRILSRRLGKQEMQKMYSAVCLSSKNDVTQNGFESIEEAEKWVIANRCCKTCREGDIYDNMCIAEWGFCKTEDLDKAEDFRDIMYLCNGMPIEMTSETSPFRKE